MTDMPQSGTHTCSYVTSVCAVNCHNSVDWVIDSGVTDNITRCHDLLTNIQSCDI